MSYFGKPSGLMDQTASAVGGIIAIDFADPPSSGGRAGGFRFRHQPAMPLCIVDTGGNHADLTSRLRRRPGGDARRWPPALGVSICADADPAEALTAALPRLCGRRCGDRAVLRAIHFFGDNDRVPRQAAALRAWGFFDELSAGWCWRSGHSSCDVSAKRLCRQRLPLTRDSPWRSACAQQVLDRARRVAGSRRRLRRHHPELCAPMSWFAAFTRRHGGRCSAPACCHVLTIRPAGAGSVRWISWISKKIRRNRHG